MPIRTRSESSVTSSNGGAKDTVPANGGDMIAVMRNGKRFKALSVAAEQIVSVCNSRGELVDEPEQWAEFTGLPREKCHGFGWTDTIHPDDLEPAMRWFKTAIQNPMPLSLRMSRAPARRGLSIFFHLGDAVAHARTAEWMNGCWCIRMSRSAGRRMNTRRMPCGN